MAVTLDLNEYGARIQTTQHFDQGDRFRFSIALRDDVVTATGRVVHVEPALNGTYEVGIEFLDIHPQDVDRIRRYMASVPPL
jgi:hypothetical protein